jgi:two-component system chemotaxis response regulator CheY
MSKRVLVVDDSATIRQQVKTVLVEAGFEVAEAVDGADGIEKIEADKELALVICDINMPRKNGFDLLETVKADGKNPNLPIVMLTTEGQPGLIQRAKKGGAKGWIVKPFKPDLLIAAVKKLAS